MANNNVQNVRFLRNGGLFESREQAKNRLTSFTLTAEMDGSVILARYTDSTVSPSEIKTLVGFVYYKDASNKSITIFDIDDASTDMKEYIESLLGDGVDTGNTVTEQLEALSGSTADTSADTSVEGAKRYADELIDGLDYGDTAVTGSYVSQVTQADGKISVSRVALPDASSVADANKVVTDVTQSKGAITATASNITGVKLAGYEEGTDADIAATDTLGQALGKLQAQINAMDKSASAENGKVVTTVAEEDGKVTETKANVKDLQLGGYEKDASATGDIASTDTINAALSKLENKAAAITIGNADHSINVTTAASGTDVALNIKSGEKVVLLGNDGIYTDLDLVKITTGLPETVKERYQLLATNDSQIGVNIDVPKDSHIVSITYITDTGDTHYQNLEYKYITDSGTTSTTYVDMSELVLETEFASGVTVTNHVAHGVLDPTSETFLTVGADGFKLSGVQDAIDSAIEALDVTDDTAVAGQYVADIEETDGIVAVKTRANVSEAVLNNYAKGTDATAVAATDTVNQAISKLENQVDAVDGLVDALSAKTFTVATSSNASIATAVTAAADGTKSVDLITDADKIKMSGFTSTGTSLSAITTNDSIATAFEKAELAIDAAKAASSTEVVEGTDTGNNMAITPATSATDGHVTYTISLSDVASASALTAEIAARKAVDGQTGQTYAVNTGSSYISGASDLNDADVKLDTALKALSDATVNEVQVNGVALTETSNAVNVQISSEAAQGTEASPIVVNTNQTTGAVTLQIQSIDCGTY